MKKPSQSDWQTILNAIFTLISTLIALMGGASCVARHF